MSRKTAPINTPIYTYYQHRVASTSQAPLNLLDLSIKINQLTRNGDTSQQPGTTPFREVVYLIILKYSLDNGGARKNVALGGTLLGATSGIKYELEKLPLPLLQMLNMFVEEFITNTCPFQIGNSQPASNFSPLLPTRGIK